MTKFSIIVPVYNVEAYLQKGLNSLINQTYSDIEIICINDGSKDNSLQVLQEYSEKDSRIIIINQENQGVSAARNIGIENSTGDYILFVDADDWLDIKTCEIINSKLNNDNCDLISFNAYFVKNNTPNQGLKKNKSNIINSEMWSICYKKDFLNKYNIRFPKGIKIAEDHIFKLQALINTKNITILDDYLYYYLSDRDNSSFKVKSIINDNIKAYYYTLEQEWYKDLAIEQKADIIDFWLKLIGRTLFSVNSKNINVSDLQELLNELKKYQAEKGINIKQINYIQCFIIMIRFHIFNLYRNIIRPVCKSCIVLPYRKLTFLLRSKHE